MKYSTLEKFMEVNNITYHLKIQRKYITPSGKPGVCVEVVVYYENEIQYLQYHCYILLKNNEVYYSEGNLEKNINSGILGVLSDEFAIDNYFESLCREYAKKYFGIV